MSAPVVVRDPETGVYARPFFDEIIERELERVRRHGQVISVLSIWLVGWQAAADAIGPEAAAIALRTAANTILANVRTTDFVFRWETDEFLVLLIEANLEACVNKVNLLGTAFRPWREGKGPVAHPLKIRVGASTLENHLQFVSVLQAARNAAKNESGEAPPFRRTASGPA